MEGRLMRKKSGSPQGSGGGGEKSKHPPPPGKVLKKKPKLTKRREVVPPSKTVRAPLPETRSESDEEVEEEPELVDEDLTPEDDDSSQEDLTEEDEDLILRGKHHRRPLSPYQPPTAFEAPPTCRMSDEEDDDPEDGDASRRQRKRPVNKPGILFLSSIPPGYNVSRTTSFFAQFGQVGRIFLQPDEKQKERNKDGLLRNFSEGWVEFMSKRVAKEVAQNLNNTQVGGKKRSKAHDVTWNIKYLSKFKWTHLSERLAYEKAVHHQKMRTEISQAKREADFFKMNVDRSKRLKRKSTQQKDGGGGQSQSGKGQSQRSYEFRQKETDEVIRASRRHNVENTAHDGAEWNASKEEEEEEGPSPSKKGKRIKSKGKLNPDEKKQKKGKGKKGGGQEDFLKSVFGAGGD